MLAVFHNRENWCLYGKPEIYFIGFCNEDELHAWLKVQGLKLEEVRVFKELSNR